MSAETVHVGSIVGKTVATYITVARTIDGGTEVLFDPQQNPIDGIRLLEDGAHRLRCGGCAACG